MTLFGKSIATFARHLVPAILSVLSCAAWGLPDIQVQGLFSGKAVLSIDGQLRMLSDGQRSDEGVELVSATASKAIILYDGEKFELDLSSRISASFSEAEVNDVRLIADSKGHYVTQARINGRSVQVMLDTGATVVAMSGNQADMLGIDYKSAPQGRVSTASGVVTSRQVRLSSVQIGNISMNAIDAVVLEGDSPSIILLGNSFLSRVDMRNDGGLMILTAPF